MLRRVVITGGPCGGKTLCAKAVRMALGPSAVIVPEASTMVMESGFPAPMPDAGIRDLEAWRKAFQGAILSTQRHLEDTWERLAREAGKRVMVCDRGFLDGAGYWPGGRDAYLGHFGLALEPTMARYDLVFHLESVAVSRPDWYGTGNNHNRYEDPAEARALDRRIREAWKGHGAQIHIPVAETMEEKARSLVESLRSRLGDGC